MLQELKRAAATSVLETHPHYRTAIGVLGISLPPILIFMSLVRSGAVESSISAYYYYTDFSRDWFVGTLWVIGVFLFFYQYRPLQPESAPSVWRSIRLGQADAWLGKAAGVSAVLVALLPTDPPPMSKVQAPEIGMAHGVAAAILFLCLSLFPLLLFSQSRKSGSRYTGLGWLMVGLLVTVAAFAFAPEGLRQSLAPWQPVLILESSLIIVFGVCWFLKGRELAASAVESSRTSDVAMLER